MATTLKAREYIKRIKEEIMTTFDLSGLGIPPAFACAGASSFAAINPLVEKTLTPNMIHISKFDTGPLPEEGTPSRGLAEWEPLYILYPNEINDARKGWKRFIEMREAQKEVRKMLKAPGACHEYIAYEAAKLAKHEAAVRFTLHIMVGACAEDYIFMPGETLDDLFIKKSLKKYKDNEEYARSMVPFSEIDPEVPSILKSIFWLVAKIWKNLTGGNIKDDIINRPYMAHFYDNSRDIDDRGLNVKNGEIKFQSALDRLKLYWKLATSYYQLGEKSKAYVALGHMVHLVSDMHVPAHVHNDIHGPTKLLGKLDSLEEWAKRADYPHIQRGENSINIKIWSSATLAPPTPDSTWEPDNINTKIDSFIEGIVTKTRQFKSVDVPGDAPGQKIISKKGLNDDECYNQAALLIPEAIKNSAQLIVNFIDYQKRLDEKRIEERQPQPIL